MLILNSKSKNKKINENENEKRNKTNLLLLSFVPLFHMVVPKRILANTSFFFNLNILSNFHKLLTNIVINIKINTPGGQSTTSNTK